MQMKRVLARVRIVHHDLHHLAPLEYERVRPLTVHGGVGCELAAAERRVQGGHRGGLVGDVVEEGVVGAVAEVVHDDGECDFLVWAGEEGLVVVGDEGEVVEFVEDVVFDDGGVRVGVGGVVDEPAGDVPVQVGWDGVEERLRGGVSLSLRNGSWAEYVLCP